MTQTFQSPSYNGYTYNGNGIRPGNVSYSSGMANVKSSPPPANITLNGPAAFQGTLTIAQPAHPLMMTSWSAQNDAIIDVYGEEGGQVIEATLHPEHDITALETLRITLLIQMIMVCGMTGDKHMTTSLQPIAYIRQHKLERHFKFRVMP
jgi:hypothetical protein